MSDKAQDSPQEKFGPYRVEERIGAGGMGVVYRALDEALQRQVALKTLLPSLAADPEFVERFKREAQSAAALNHPNITQIYTIGQEGSTPFFAMELIRGRSLESMVKERGAVPPSQATAYILQAAQGLRHASQKKLIHRDIKPSNLMLTEDGVVKITDFGLAKVARSETQLTATGEVLGSPGYISPGQAQGLALALRSDIYSLGATCYHLVVGRLPFEAPTPVAMVVKHMNEPLRSPRAVNPAVPYPIASAIQKMMAKRAGERFQDYDALIRELERAQATIGTEGASAARATGQAGTPSWSGTTGAELRPRAGRGPAPPAPGTTGTDGSPSRGVSWPLLVLASLLGALVLAGVAKHRSAFLADGDAAEPPAAPSGASPSPARPPVETQMSYTRHPVADAFRQGLRAGMTVDERMRERYREKSRANLSFVSNDHSVLPDGRIKVFGKVQNNGGSVASQARVRVRILLDNGEIAAQGETPLDPALIPPQGTATYDLPLDYNGPVGTIKAELIWVE